MYLTDVLDAASMDKSDYGDNVPLEYLEAQRERMKPILDRAIELERMHRELLPDIPFAWGFLRYIDYIIYRNTTGTKQ